jgi:hypothetical protein
VADINRNARPTSPESARSLQKPAPAPIIGLQHPLSFYDAFARGAW